jgi:hypothetical protein
VATVVITTSVNDKGAIILTANVTQGGVNINISGSARQAGSLAEAIVGLLGVNMTILSPTVTLTKLIEKGFSAAALTITVEGVGQVKFEAAGKGAKVTGITATVGGITVGISPASKMTMEELKTNLAKIAEAAPKFDTENVARGLVVIIKELGFTSASVTIENQTYTLTAKAEGRYTMQIKIEGGLAFTANISGTENLEKSIGTFITVVNGARNMSETAFGQGAYIALQLAVNPEAASIGSVTLTSAEGTQLFRAGTIKTKEGVALPALYQYTTNEKGVQVLETKKSLLAALAVHISALISSGLKVDLTNTTINLTMGEGGVEGTVTTTVTIQGVEGQEASTMKVTTTQGAEGPIKLEVNIKQGESASLTASITVTSSAQAKSLLADFADVVAIGISALNPAEAMADLIGRGFTAVSLNINVKGIGEVKFEAVGKGSKVTSITATTANGITVVISPRMSIDDLRKGLIAAAKLDAANL